MSFNRLIDEKSPYLLQHAHNPTDWHPWGDEAFAKAHNENKPIFLSVGYATCHWCHVMEKESFEDHETARYLNDTFVCVKVDREERPDIDAVYMSACQMLSGQGGWPLTVFMTPDKKPFFATTYVPKHSRFGRAGLIELCQRAQTIWNTEQDRVVESSIQITDSLKDWFVFSPGDPEASVLDDAYQQFVNRFDARFGGFEPAPKFPTPHRYLFLLNYYRKTGKTYALDIVKETLAAMRLGGIWDHVGFGFHRYSTDHRWLLPHFEKMLYDQALAALAYLETFRIDPNPLWAQTAEELFEYVLRDMTSEHGGFFSAEDADSEGVEGKFYVWTLEEFQKVMQPEEADLWMMVFNLSRDGNFAEEATGHQTGANILYLDKTPKQWADRLNMSETEFRNRLTQAAKILADVRSRRIRPLKDDKILTDWNGLMIAALAVGARILGKSAYADAAQQAARFILDQMIDAQGKLLHRFRDHQAAIPAFADDYAFMILGFLELFETTSDRFWIEQAELFQNLLIENFWDSGQGGFFMTSEQTHELPIRPKDLYDDAVPSANSVSLNNLIRLHRMTGKPEWKERSDSLIRTFFGDVKANPSAYTYFLLGL